MEETNLGLTTLSESGGAPSERMKDANRCREIAAKLRGSDDKRNRANQRIKGCYDGNLPYNTAKLTKLAQKGRANINWQELRATKEAAMVPYFDLLRGASRMVSIRLDNDDDFLTEEYSEIASEEFDHMLKEWPGFMHHMDLVMSDRLLYGRGLAMWPNRYTPEFLWVNFFNTHVPDQTGADPEKVELLVIEEEMPVDKLYRHSKEPRWNKAECLAAIRRAESSTTRSNENRADLEQQKLADKDMLDGMATEKVHVSYAFQKEFDGKVSVYVVEMDGNRSTLFSDDKPGGYLYRAPREYENFRQAIWATFHDTSDGSWNGASGLGKAVIAQFEIKNRVKCSMVDLGFMRSAINMSAKTAADWASGAAYKNLGNINIFSPGMEPINAATYIGDMEGMFGLDRELEQTLARNTGIFRQLPEKGQGNPLTATGEMLRTQQATVLTNSAVTRFYSDLDRLYTELYRRTVQAVPDGVRCEMVKEFLARCEDRGLKAADLRKVKSVRAYRNIGNGSVVMRQQALSSLASVASLYPEEGKMEWLRDTTVGFTDVETANRYGLSKKRDKITLDHQIAALESNALVQGGAVVIGGYDNHVIHAQTHMQWAVNGLQSVEQGADPATVLAANDKLMPHADQHIRFLEGNPARKNEARALRDQWKQIAGANDQLSKNAQEILQKRQEQAEAERQAEAIRMGQDPKVMIDLERSRAELAMANERNQQALAHHKQKHEQELAIADANTAASIQRETAATLAKIQQQQAQLGASIEDMGKRTEAEANKAKAEGDKAAAAPALPEINIELKGQDKGAPKKVSFERDAKGRVKKANVVIELAEGKTSKTVEFSRDKEGRIAGAAVKNEQGE